MSALAPTARERKPPRRTAQRILETALDLFNRYGEPQVSPNMIAGELGISPGNLYYHYAAKDELVQALHTEWARRLDEEAALTQDAASPAGARQGFQRLLRLAWQYRFLTRNLNDLMARSRPMETEVPAAFAAMGRAVEHLLQAAGLTRDALGGEGREALRTSLVLALTCWFNRELVLDPRHGTDEANAEALIERGLTHIDGLLGLAQMKVRETTAA